MAVVPLGLLGSGNASTAGTTLAVVNTTGAAIPAGTFIHVTGTWDNIASVTAPTITCSTIGGATATANNATPIGSGVTTTAGSGIWHTCFRARTTASIASGATIATLTSNQSAVKRAAHCEGWSGALETLRGTVTTATSTTGTATVTTTGTALVVGDLVIGSASFENNAQMTADADTAGGSWPPIVGTFTTGGGAATNVGTATQYKILTATGTQTFNPTGGVADTVVCVYSVQPEPDPTVTQAAYRWFDEGTESGAVALAAQDTPVVGDITNGDATGTLRVRLQSTNATTLPATDDWQLQWEKNANSLWSPVGPTNEMLADEYAATNRDTGLTPTVTFSPGQSFMGNGGLLTRASFFTLRGAAPTSTMTAAIYAHTGTFGSGLGTGSPLATSTSRVSSSLLGVSPNSAWNDFVFDGTFTLAAGTPYVLVLTVDVASADPVSWGTDTSSATHAGNSTRLISGVWSAGSPPGDMIFRVYTTPSPVVPYDSPNLTNGAATTNRLTGGTGTFVAGKVSEDGLMDDLGLTGNNFTELVYALKIKATGVVNTDVLRFRVLRNAATTGLTFTQVPTITITQSVVTGGTAAGTYLWAGSTTTGARAPKATAAGTYLWAGSATGMRTPKAQAAGAYDYTGTATGRQPPNRGAATGAYLWAGATTTGARTPKATGTGAYVWTGATTTGQRTPKAQGTGTYLWAGTATGKRAPKATTTGTHDWAKGTVSGIAPVVGAKVGTATGGFLWAGTAVGLRPTVAAKVGTATGAYDWSGSTTTGKRTPKSTGTGAYDWAGSSTGKRTPKATGTGAYAWTGATTTGARTPKATGTGAYLWAGSTTTGKRAPKATTSGAYAFDKGTVTGIAPVVGVKQGSATGGFLWAGTATGKKTPKAVGAGAYDWAGSTTTGKRVPKASGLGAYLWAGSTTTGKRTPKATGLGAYLWAGTATGKTIPKATGLGAYTYAGIGTGKRAPKATGLGAYLWAGTSTGTTTRRGTTSGTYSYAGLGTGTAPTVGEQTGTAFGTFLWAGTATGRKVPRAAAAGAYAWAGTATGKRPNRGVGTGAYAFDKGLVSGKRTPKASSSGTFLWAGTATGREPIKGTATGTYTYAGTSTGRRTPKATATATYLYAGTGVGRKAPLGTGTGTYRWAGNALGSAPGISGHDGFAFGTYNWAGSTSTGRRQPKATGTGAYAWAGSSVGVVTRTGQAVGTYLYVGTAFGDNNFPDPRDIELIPGRPRFAWAGQVRTDWHGGKPRVTRMAGTPRFDKHQEA